MKKIVKIFLIFLIFTISFIFIDGICARFLDTRPIISKKEVLKRGSLEIETGYLYKSLFADVYYCDTVVTTYDEDNNSSISNEVIRYYKRRGETFECRYYIDERADTMDLYRDQAQKYKNMEYMRFNTEGLYKTNYDYFGSYNKKLNVFTVNYIGDYYVDYDYQDVYMFNVDDFSLEPIKLKIDGFDMVWRTKGKIFYSSSGNIMAFNYFCGYRPEQWMGWQKYNEDDCKKNSNDNGIYVFRVNGINDYTLLGYYSDKRNEFIKEYKDTYFVLYDVLDDKNIIIKYTITNNKHMEPDRIVYYKWNFDSDTLTEWQV